jgi:predicted nucleic acid-binding protein
MCINNLIDTHDMRTNILIDDDLMEAAMLATGVRSKKETVRRYAIDVMIATFCIENGHKLLFSDKDFAPFVEHLGLIAAE